MSENIFSNLYNRVLNFFQKDRLQDAESSKDTATNRLKLVLMQDRSNLDGATMQKMREQLITVISKYVEIDQEALDLNLEADGDEIALMLNIPVIRARTKEEIEEIEAQEQESLNSAGNDSEEECEVSGNTDENESEEESSDNCEKNDDNNENTDSEADENQEDTSSDTDAAEEDSSDELADNDEHAEADTGSSDVDTNENKKSKKHKNN